jgi:hypothetical protein
MERTLAVQKRIRELQVVRFFNGERDLLYYHGMVHGGPNFQTKQKCHSNLMTLVGPALDDATST